MKVLSLAWMVVLSFSSYANNTQDYQNNVDFAKGAINQVQSASGYALDVNDYCADSACQQEVASPSLKGASDAAITDKATTEFFINNEAQTIQGNFDKGRPDVKNDPTYQYALIGQENAFEISHGISNEYVDCDNGTQCITEYSPKTCNAPTHNSVPCTKTPTFTASLSPVIYTCPSGWSRQGYNCKRTIQQCRYNSSNAISQSGGNSNCASNRTSYLWNGKYVTSNQGFTKGVLKSSSSWGACKGSNWRRSYEICGPVQETIKASLSCSGGYTLSGGNCVKNTLTWQTQCTLLKECKVISQTCVEGRSTRTINGVPTTLDCWKYQVNHRCDTVDTCATLKPDCETLNATCSLKQNGVCIEEEFTKSCPYQSCSDTALICGEDNFFLDGEFYEPTPTQSDDFNRVASGLGVLEEAAKDLTDPPKMFAGQSKQCTDKAFGFADCCKDGGWGTGIGLDECSEDEKALGQAKEQKTTIELGSYCASKVLGVCTRKKKTYCVFDSKLSRIIQEQGVKGQLGISLGTPKSPICGAITPEQMQQINFDVMDFSDFYAEMNENVQIPSPTEIQNRLSSSLQE
ncbi:type-F conjugative transfer system mating-pair stabilization protein TraN [Vibrio cyclitrophicus]|uniref:Type-F conjugative transfer system mating-pair stabilization protein TraN n=2 Tax=Vibrio cyclitrophicus TaxID=47951 RepID=A0A7Z1MK62_9VIBR|nr:type-F conjugative transfer system mating-pair stabilization protein TraN [Vibrio cyclitrophicus]PMP21138.1 type-F conjugative transfer system mating-pair stabilization protein TraN [Vibrio cyclitrophicus]PMP30515.1 type-F conjugative transfer system mating-pair stabilization protein TraN [Vibrio cyclitrophicus]